MFKDNILWMKNCDVAVIFLDEGWMMGFRVPFPLPRRETRLDYLHFHVAREGALVLISCKARPFHMVRLGFTRPVAISICRLPWAGVLAICCGLG